ncbi:MAG TPA: hypothetical protein VE690_01850, partial [Rhodopila sp.]|nr:hypothetical protein [Rhodopila sp.]
MSGSQTSGIPAVAAAVGYNAETFGPNVSVGSNWQKFSFYGVNPATVNVTQNSDGSVTINPGGDNYGGQLSTASVDPTAGSFQGIAFGGGGYFQATMSFNGPASFWANDIETMNGVSEGRGPNQWPGQPTGYGNWIEADMAEFDSPGVYGVGIHNWYGSVGSGNDTNTGPISGSPVYPAGADFTNPNTYGFLWVPATATTQGYAKFFFNGVQVGNTITWNQYNPSAGPAPSLSNGTAFSVMDSLHLALILGTGASSSVHVYSVAVWQKSAANDISTLGQGTGAPPPPPSADDTVVLAGSTAAITDAGGNQWTITNGGQVAVNGVTDTTTGRVIELAYVNGTVWQENADKLWWGKTSPTAAWSPGTGTATSPLPAQPSANDTVVLAGSTAAITDASGNQWTITSSGQVAVNGTPDTTTGRVIELAYVNGTVWQENADKLWWGKTSPTAAWSPGAGTPTSPLPPPVATLKLYMNE